MEFVTSFFMKLDNAFYVITGLQPTASNVASVSLTCGVVLTVSSFIYYLYARTKLLHEDENE